MKIPRRSQQQQQLDQNEAKITVEFNEWMIQNGEWRVANASIITTPQDQGAPTEGSQSHLEVMTSCTMY